MVRTTFDFPDDDGHDDFVDALRYSYQAFSSNQSSNYGNASAHINFNFAFLGMPPRHRPPPPPPPMPQRKDTRTRVQKLQELAERGTTLGERNAAIHALARLQAKGEI